MSEQTEQSITKSVIKYCDSFVTEIDSAMSQKYGSGILHQKTICEKGKQCIDRVSFLSLFLYDIK